MRWLKTHLTKLLAVLLGTAVLAGSAYVMTQKSPEDHLKKGIALQQHGDLKGAEIELKNALQGLPDHADARYRLGQIHFAHGDYPSAEKELKKARELGLRDAALDPLYARTLLLLGEPKRLLDEVSVRVDAKPEARAALLALRARAQWTLNNPAAGEKSLAEAEAAAPDHPETLLTRAMVAAAEKKAEQALALVDKALGKAPQRADAWLMKGDLLRSAKQYEQALRAYGKALEIEPANASARLARAQMYVEAENLDQASADLKELRKHAPNHVMGLYLEAYIEFRHKHFTESKVILQDILRTAPGFLPGHLLAGAINIALGNREAARFHLDKVLSAAPQHSLARKLMAATLADLGDLEQAKQMLATFGNSATDPLLHTLQGQIALRQGDYAEARKHLEQVPAGTSQNAKYFTDLAASRMGSGDEAGAVAALSKAAELETGDTRPDVLLVMTHLKGKRYAEAMKVVDKLEQERPNDPINPNLRGIIHLSQNNVPKARASFLKALQIQPAYFPATSNLALLDIRDKDPSAARARFQQHLKHNPEESRAWMALAALDAREGNEAGQLNNLEQAKKVQGKAPQPRLQLIRYWLGKKDAGKALVEARSALDSTGLAEFNEYIGLALAAQGDQANALATFGKWAAASPRNPVAQYRLAQAQIAAKDLAGALKSLDKALALRADFLDASLSKALLLGQTGRAQEGLAIARALQAKAPKAAAGFLAEAEILFGEKKYLEAGRLYAKGAELSGQGQALGRAYQAYVQGGQGAEGEKLLEQWLKTHADDAVVRHQLALSQLNAKRLPEAANHYRTLVRANPKDLVAYNNLAWLLGELHDKDALPVAEQAYQLSPNEPAVQDTLGWLLVNAGQTGRGLDLLRAARAKAPAAADIHWHLAAALAKSGDRPQARKELEKLIYSGSAFPQKAEAQRLLDSLK